MGKLQTVVGAGDGEDCAYATPVEKSPDRIGTVASARN